MSIAFPNQTDRDGCADGRPSDQTKALHQLKAEGVAIDTGDLAFLSPYATSKLKRFAPTRPSSTRSL
jgi:hypothetical protein